MSHIQDPDKQPRTAWVHEMQAREHEWYVSSTAPGFGQSTTRYSCDLCGQSVLLREGEEFPAVTLPCAKQMPHFAPGGSVRGKEKA